MRAIQLVLPATILVVLMVALPAAAGNWATVRLDEPLAEAMAGRPWRVGFVVRQHDRTPTNEVTPRLTARHHGSGETVRAAAVQEGAVGHFVVEATFPAAGSWKWAIAPDPFPETTFDALVVSGGAATPTAAGSPAAGSPELEAGRREVEIVGSVFSPGTLTIAAGDRVVWRNMDGLAHTVAGEDLAFADSGILDQGDRFEQVFGEPGVYRYHCGPHPRMTGTIVVR